jgi:hypothetical protein
MQRPILHAAAVLLVLSAVAVIAPAPAESNRNFYEHSGREVVMPGCDGGDCFRPLLPVVLERLPGSSLVKWKTYAVLANVVGAVGVWRFSLLVGLSSTAALGAMWLSALGAGTLYSLFDVYTSDPLMYMLGPLIAIWLWRGQVVRATAAGALGIFAKEFAAAPLWIFALFAVLDRRWNAALRLASASVLVTLVWLATHASFMAALNYAYGSTASADLLHGGFLATWLRSVRVRGALMYLFTSFSALYLLWPVGLVRCRRELRLLAAAAVPALVAFVYVEQPERALWNFHFIVIPLAAMVLAEVPGWTMALFVACFGVTNLRFGAQFEIRGPARIALLLSLAIAALAAVRVLRRPVEEMGGERPAALDDRVSPVLASASAIAYVVLFALLVVALFDVASHRRSSTRFGVNQWGYRGALVGARHSGVHMVMVGGSAAFAARTAWPDTVPAQLASEINARLGWTRAEGPYSSIANLAEPGAGAASYAATLGDYAYQRPDIVCVYDGYDAESSPGTLGRHRSVVFRATGYLPRSRLELRRGSDPLAGAEPQPAPLLLDAGAANGGPSCAGQSAAYCAAMIETVRAGLRQGSDVVVATPPYLSARHDAQQRSLGEALAREFGRERRFQQVDLGRAIDLRDSTLSADGVYPTPLGARIVAARLAEAMLERVRARLQ